MKKSDKKSNKGKRILKILLLDMAGYLLAMGIFLLFFYVIPYELEADGSIVGREENMVTFEIPEKQTGTKGHNRGGSGKNRGGVDRSNTDTEDIAADSEEAENIMGARVETERLVTKESENTSISITKNTFGNGNDTVTYYVADIYVTGLNYFKTAFAHNTYGSNIKEDILVMADSNNALLAITGDSYGNNSTGIVVRNGVLYRTDENEADVCVLYMDGTMETYTAEEFDEEAVLAEGVWQAWCFGPALLDRDGNILSKFNSTGYLSENHPRAAIGYVEPGHYMLVIVDGRDEGYSRGVTITELSAIMEREGALRAYNLDGGGSVSMVFDGAYINKASGRDISDIIYVTES